MMSSDIKYLKSSENVSLNVEGVSFDVGLVYLNPALVEEGSPEPHIIQAHFYRSAVAALLQLREQKKEVPKAFLKKAEEGAMGLCAEFCEVNKLRINSISIGTIRDQPEGVEQFVEIEAKPYGAEI